MLNFASQIFTIYWQSSQYYTLQLKDIQLHGSILEAFGSLSDKTSY